MRAHLRERAGTADRVKLVTSRQQKSVVETAAAAAAFLANQEITTTGCPECGSEVSGVNGRYACGVCGWVNHWSQGHTELPAAPDGDA
jgi:ribosomal protein S27AE